MNPNLYPVRDWLLPKTKKERNKSRKTKLPPKPSSTHHPNLGCSVIKNSLLLFTPHMAPNKNVSGRGGTFLSPRFYMTYIAQHVNGERRKRDHVKGTHPGQSTKKKVEWTQSMAPTGGGRVLGGKLMDKYSASLHFRAGCTFKYCDKLYLNKKKTPLHWNVPRQVQRCNGNPLCKAPPQTTIRSTTRAKHWSIIPSRTESPTQQQQHVHSPTHMSLISPILPHEIGIQTAPIRERGKIWKPGFAQN